MKSRVNESINFIMRLESGVQDPVSSNQTIGDNFSGKDFGIGRSYIDWKINNNANIFAGKMKLPWIRYLIHGNFIFPAKMFALLFIFQSM